MNFRLAEYVMCIASILIVSLLAACSSAPTVKEFFDSESSVVVNYTDTPIIFYIDRSGRAAFARDFVNVGPIQVNRMGDRRYYLWLGIWNTIDTANKESRAAEFELVTVYADGEPILLDLAGWTSEVVGASRPIYAKPVSSATEAYYEVTIDQIRLMAAATEIRIQTSGEPSASYEMWDRSTSSKRGLSEFLAQVSY